MHGNIEKETDTEIEKSFNDNTGGCEISVSNKSLNDSKEHSLEPT